jgi:hypothetical protein
MIHSTTAKFVYSEVYFEVHFSVVRSRIDHSGILHRAVAVLT